MSILVVDDSKLIRHKIKSILNSYGYMDLIFAESAAETFSRLGLDEQGNPSLSSHSSVNLILLDIVLPDMDGIKVCQTIKSIDYLKDIPILIVTGSNINLEEAYLAGAMDYIIKPISPIELQTRIKWALELKKERDQRKIREKELEEVIQELNHLTMIDGLTGIANRRRYEEYIQQEWLRGLRNKTPISILLIDIDFFKDYNDAYGHIAGDQCLKLVATTIKGLLNRPADLVCRYGGEEFIVFLPETDEPGALLMAENIRASIEKLAIAHKKSSISSVLTISLGVATMIPGQGQRMDDLIAQADTSLYQAKDNGRNRVGISH